LSARSLRLAIAIAALALFAALAGGASADAATVVNGGFETGTLSGWTVFKSVEFVGWNVGKNEETEPSPSPFSGSYYAGSFQTEPGTTILYQDIALEPNSSHQLQLAFAYFSDEPITIPVPDTLTASEVSPPNQQVRIDVMKPTAPITSVEPSDILATVFASSESENLEGEESEPGLEPKLLTADLSQFAGQTVRLRIAVAVTRNPLVAFVDNVAVTSTPLLAPVVPPTPAPPAPPSNLFTKGKVTLNKKNGTATLAVSVPDAGTLTATDAHSKVATASLARTTTKPKTKPVYVKAATVSSTGAGIVKVPIVPTAAAKKILAKKGKVAVSVKLTFAPTGGSAATQAYSGKLVKALKPAPR
jgi:hypothetical protein